MPRVSASLLLNRNNWDAGTTFPPSNPDGLAKSNRTFDVDLASRIDSGSLMIESDASGLDVSDSDQSSSPSSRNGEPQTSPAELTEGCSRWLKASCSFVYVEVSSLLVLFACIALWSPTALFKYAISVASISFGICLILQTMEFLSPGFLIY